MNSHQRISRWLVAVAAATALGACGAPAGEAASPPAGTSPPGGSGRLGDAPRPAPTTPAPPAPTRRPLARPLTCAQLQEAAVTTAGVKLEDYPFDSINLTGGRFGAEDGTEIELLRPCAIGDVVGDGSADAVGTIVLASGGTGRFHTVLLWRNASAKPVLAATVSLGDRNPVSALSIAGRKVTVVYLTRTDGFPMAGVNLKRTAVYTVSGTKLVEQSHSDEPYTP